MSLLRGPGDVGSNISTDWPAAIRIDKLNLVFPIASFETCVISSELRTYKMLKAVSATALT